MDMAITRPLSDVHAERAGFPPQIRYIVGNEACERFSFYGMRSILVIYMVQYLLMSESHAKGIFHLFVSASYFIPLFGAVLADRFLGKYRTIFYLSLVYCGGHLVLALNDQAAGMYAGLLLIAIGTGGIKPCVSAFVGDQFGPSNSHLINRVYELFYWSINFGSFFSTLLIPWVLPHLGPHVAFGIPGVLMALATVIFWVGRRTYVNVPPSQEQGGSQFGAIVWHALTHARDRRPGETLLDTAKSRYDVEKVEGAKSALRLFQVFISVAAFWSLWDQQGSSWVLQAQQMERNVMGVQVEAPQMQALNPIMILVLIPMFSFWIYPFVDRYVRVTPLRKMGTGMVLAAAAFSVSGVLQLLIDEGHRLSIAWQAIPYLLLAVSEIMVSITGLEFAYTQAPPWMKSTIMSFWLLTVAGGNIFDAVFFTLNKFQGSAEFFFYTIMMLVVAGIFIVMASRYREKSYVPGAGTA